MKSAWLAGGGAVLLVLALSGVVAAASMLVAGARMADPTQPVAAVDTTNTFEDLDGNGVDDDCQTGVVANADAAAAALLAADLNGDGTLSVSEAAHTGWTGGKHCNHGGYVSQVAHALGQDCVTTPPTVVTQPATVTTLTVATEPTDATDADEANETDEAKDADEATETNETADAADEAKDAADEATESSDCTPVAPAATTAALPVVCVAAPAPAAGTVPTGTTAPAPVVASNAHGKLVSAAAHDKTLVGGKNCNHGGAVSEIAKQDHAAKKAAHDAAKAAREAARAAKKLGKHAGG
jgi:hypothetical protein